jgi:hypothetical protein
MTAKLKAYRCENAACSLGSRNDPGQFTGGITQDQAIAISGDPKAKHGDGYCPNCGEKGKADGTHGSVTGRDPLQPLHDQVAARVDDPTDPLTAEDAQPALEALVGKES